MARGLGKITDRIQDKNNKKLSPLALSSPRVFKILVIEENSKSMTLSSAKAVYSLRGVYYNDYHYDDVFVYVRK